MAYIETAYTFGVEVKSCLSFGWGLEGSNGKKWRGNKKKRFCSEMWGNAVWGGLVKILWASSYLTILWKLSLSKGSSLLRGGLAATGLHTGLKGVSGYCYHCWVLGATITSCIDVCLEKKKGDSGKMSMLIICLVEATRWKCGDSRVGSSCWTVVVGWQFLVVPVWTSVGGWAHWETELGV